MAQLSQKRDSSHSTSKKQRVKEACNRLTKWQLKIVVQMRACIREVRKMQQLHLSSEKIIHTKMLVNKVEMIMKNKRHWVNRMKYKRRNYHGCYTMHQLDK